MNEYHYGVVVGINKYPGIKHLKRARKDAEDFYAWLIAPDGGDLPVQNVELITVPDERIPDDIPLEQAQPVRRQIEAALDKFRKQCKAHIDSVPTDWAKTRLYFFASGHGIAPTAEDAALLMADASRDFYGRNFSCSKYLSSFQKEQQFKELVFFADCCRERVNNVSINGPEWTEVPSQNGEILIVRGYATYFGERAFEQSESPNDPDELRGYFTKALLEGLKQAINLDTHEIDAVTLSDFVTQRVEALTKHFPKPQKPFFISEPVSPRIIFKRDVSAEYVKQETTHESHIYFPVGFTGCVNLFSGEHKLMGKYEVGNNPWIIPLRNGLYRVKLENGSSPFPNNGYFEILGGNQDVYL